MQLTYEPVWCRLYDSSYGLQEDLQPSYIIAHIVGLKCSCLVSVPCWTHSFWILNLVSQCIFWHIWNGLMFYKQFNITCHTTPNQSRCCSTIFLIIDKNNLSYASMMTVCWTKQKARGSYFSYEHSNYSPALTLKGSFAVIHRISWTDICSIHLTDNDPNGANSKMESEWPSKYSGCTGGVLAI